MADSYNALKVHLDPQITIPDLFFLPPPDGELSCFFMISCLGHDSFLYLDDSFKALTGYGSSKIKEAGMDFWFSLMHPEDREQVSKKVIESHQLLASDAFNPLAPTPMILIYRIKHANGSWIWIRDTKYLMSLNKKIIDKVLGKYEVISPENTPATAIKKKMDEDESCTKLLDFALVHQYDAAKESLPAETETDRKFTPIPLLTKREKEILQLIAGGLSTKMIADKCHISVNTVETHRRHLLEKFRVRNSMELIKETSKIYWL